MDMSIVFRKQFVSVSALMSNLGIQIGTSGEGKTITANCLNQIGMWECWELGMFF